MTLVTDFRHAFRLLRKSPGFTLIAVITLALGIGANTVMFSSINGALLKPFVFPQLGRVMAVWETVPKKGYRRVSAAAGNFHDWNEQNHSFAALAASSTWNANVTGGGTPERVEGARVTADFFAVTGVPALYGRTTSREDFEASRPPVVVLGYGFWQKRLGSDPTLVGRTLNFDGQAYTVIGIMPREYDFPTGTQAWSPLVLRGTAGDDRQNHFLKVIGRLKPGVSEKQAQDDLASIATREGQQFPATNAGHSVRVTDLVSDYTNGTRQFILVLGGAAAFVLLLACANVANLQLARATGRAREVAVRAALGASRGRIIQQLLAESLALAGLGAAAGLLIGKWGLEVSMASVPAFIMDHIPGLKQIQLDGRVLLFTLIAAALAGVLTGIAPALHVSRPDLNEALKEGLRGSGSSTRGRHRMRALLVVSEIAVAIVLLIGAGLMVKGFREFAVQYQGFDRNNVLTFRLTLPKSKYNEAQVRDFYRQLVDRLEALPGVESAALVSSLPSGWSWNQAEVTIEGRPTPQASDMHVAVSQPITPDYFRTLRIPLNRGRAFTSQDGPDALPVLIISEAMARQYWPGQDPLGHRMRLGPAEEPNSPWRTIVGVSGDIRQSSFDREPNPTVYIPVAQMAQASMSVAIRTAGDPMTLVAAVRSQVQGLDRDQPIYDIRTLDQLISDNISGVTFSAQMMTVFGIVALVLAAAGIFAVMAYSVAQRTHEIGVRMALGARRSDVLRLVVGNALLLAIVGIGIGLPVSFGVARLLASTLFGVVRMDVLVFVIFTLVLAVTAVVAGYLPARWATKVDPTIALRYE